MAAKLSKNIIFANNNSYLTFAEIDQENKGFFNFKDLSAALSFFGAEGISDFYAELSRTIIYEESWIKYIQNDNPYKDAKKNKISISWQDRLRIKREQVKRTFEDASILIVEPKSHKATVLYGYDTKWCYASASTDEHYNDVKNASLFYIIFNKMNKNKPYYKFILTVNKPTGTWLFEDQTNRMLTSGITYDQNMKRTDENSIRHMDFLFKNKRAMKELKCSTSSQIQT